MAERKYGWLDGKALDAHGYLVPALRRVVEEERSRMGEGALRIADIGSGNGYVSGEMAAWGNEVVGIEPSPDGIAHAQTSHPSIRFVEGSVYDEGLSQTVGREFDVVVSLEVIEHLLYPRELLRRAHEMLKNGGLLILSTPYHGYWKNLALALANAWDTHFKVEWDGGHVKFFSAATLAKLVTEAGFGSVSFRGVGRAPFLWKSMIVSARRQ